MTTERKILAGFFLALLILVLLGVVSYQSSQKLVESVGRVTESQEALEAISQLTAALLDVQSTSRGYVITGRENYLESYRSATTRLRQLVTTLRQKTKADVEQQRRMDELGPLVTERIGVAEEVIRARREKGFEAAQALILSDRGKQITDSIRSMLDDVEREERRLLQERSEQTRALSSRTIAAFVAGSLVAIGIVGLAIWALQRDFQARHQAEQTLQESENRFRDLVENSGVVICTHDKEGRILSANRALVQLTGYDSVDEVVGKSLADFLAPEVAEQFPKYLNKVVSEGRATGIMRIRTRAGEERFLEYNNTLRYDPAGPPIVRGTALDITDRLKAERQVRQSREDLAALVNDLQVRSLEITRLSEISDMLQTCQNPEEAYKATALSVTKMFPSMSGALCVLEESRSLLEAVATWGPAPPGERVFSPEDCWALRRGRPHLVQDSTLTQRCKHVGDATAGSHLCVPMMAHGETIGIFYLHGETARAMPATLIEAQQRLAVTIGEQVGLSIANLKLRETLRQQSIRDALTGLYNRRYMEESLDRELRRASRNNRPMAVMMLDIDHFKRFNDTFGHEAGDLLLRALGEFLSSHVRGDDIACRYGGEEFALIFPESTLESARERAEWLRENVKHLSLQHEESPLGTISISLGIAAFPDHDSTPRGLLHAADQALYRAKREGRDRVVLAGTSPAGPPLAS